jgi:hypothetical protein
VVNVKGYRNGAGNGWGLVLRCALAAAIVLVLCTGCVMRPPQANITGENAIIGEVSDTLPVAKGSITINGAGEFAFDPEAITTVRPDLFAQGQFSVFDVLVHLSETGRIDLAYHFDEGQNSHVIDTLEGRGNWWYYAHYDGGWEETNAFRMDHFPVKDRMTIVIMPSDPSLIDQRQRIFAEEVQRKADNGGRVIIPGVIVNGVAARRTFENVEVASHDLRADLFQPGTITAVDVIMSLGDRGAITYDLRWEETIGPAVVKSYYVDRIDGDQSAFRCGFVYEAGSTELRGFQGNHIHIPSDARILNSPEYVEFYWICL